jgi:outer membrane protein OmpA-like peptidoglycan-associated protein
MCGRRLVVPLLSLVGLVTARDAFAQVGDGVRPPLDARGYLTVDGSQTLDRGDISFGLGALDWGHDLSAPGVMPVSDAMTATLAAAFGLPGPIPIEIAATQPISIASIGQGTGDLGLHAKVQLLDGRKHVIGVGVIARAYLPVTASGPMSALGPSGVVPEVDGVIDARLGRLRLAATAGARWISGAQTMPFGGAAAFAVVPERFEVLAEVTGTVGLGSTAATLEGLGGVKLYLARNSYLTLAAGRGLDTTGGSDTRALISIVFEPKPAQMIHDDVDGPPEPAEPPPTPPAPPEPPPPPDCNATPRPDGCLNLAEVVESKIVILKGINFEFDKAVITPDSFPVLDAVAETLVKNPDIWKVEIGGHTDERGDAAYNLSLSDRRAAAVVVYLSQHGIDASRLSSRGYGKTRPVDTAHNEDAWTKNRRVEFVIVERD